MYHKSLSWAQRGALWLRLSIRLALLGGLGLFTWFFLPPLLSLLAPFVAALVVAALLNPSIAWLQRQFGLRRGLLSLLVLFVLLALICWGIWWLVFSLIQELTTLAQNWQPLLNQCLAAAAHLELRFTGLLALLPPVISQSVDDLALSLLTWWEEFAPLALDGLVVWVGETAQEIPGFLLATLVFLMAAFFLTADYPYLRTQVASQCNLGLLRFCHQVQSTVIAAFGGYLKAQFFLSLGVFFILLVGFLFTRQSYGLLLALGLAVLDFIPILGAGTVMVPWAFLTLVTGDATTGVQLMAIWGVIALFRRVAEPKFVGSQTGLSPILSLLCIYVGLQLAGVFGMILGPIFALVFLNLSGLGLFHRLHLDLSAAVADVCALLAQSTSM